MKSVGILAPLQDKFTEWFTNNVQVSRKLSMSVLWTSFQPEKCMALMPNVTVQRALSNFVGVPFSVPFP